MSQAAPLDIVILGLAITSSWGNGHATTYRGLVRELTARGHRVLFLERDQPWYADNRDMPLPPFGHTVVYSSLADLRSRHAAAVRDADLVIVGSYVAEGREVGEWVVRTAHGATAFYDIDTPVTLAKLARGEHEYISPALIRRYDMYLSFTGGPIIEQIERRYGSRMARPLYCSVDERLYFPEARTIRWDLGYMGTYSEDRQPSIERLMFEPARAWAEGRFVLAGPQYPDTIRWPSNVKRIAHLAPRDHRTFYNRQRFTLNVTRADMIEAGYSPSVRLFEAAACATPIISDLWEGLDTLFVLGEEVLVARTAADVLRYMRELSEDDRRAIGARARERVLAAHTSAHRAAELEEYACDLLAREPAA